jgi:hypothetical protein
MRQIQFAFAAEKRAKVASSLLPATTFRLTVSSLSISASTIQQLKDSLPE